MKPFFAYFKRMKCNFRVFEMPQFPFGFEFEPERPNGNSATKQSSNYHSSDWSNGRMAIWRQSFHRITIRLTETLVNCKTQNPKLKYINGAPRINLCDGGSLFVPFHWSGSDPGLLVGGAPTYKFVRFSPKLHEIKKMFDP